MTGRSPSGRATRASPEPASVLGQSASVPSAAMRASTIMLYPEGSRQVIELSFERREDAEKVFEWLETIAEGDAAASVLLSLRAELGCKNEHLRNLIRRAECVMTALEEHGGVIVPHLIDTDDNPGQFLRGAIEDARSALGDAQ